MRIVRLCVIERGHLGEANQAVLGSAARGLIFDVNVLVRLFPFDCWFLTASIVTVTGPTSWPFTSYYTSDGSV
jgi:hypothetical protein